MAITTATVTVPILARVGGKDIHIGDLTVEAKVVNGRLKGPTEREIKALLRKGLR